MPFTDGKTWQDGEKVTAADLNEQIRDNWNEVWKFTARGDLWYALSNNTAAKLAIGSNGYSLIASNGVPAWVNACPGLFQAANDLIIGAGADSAVRLAAPIDAGMILQSNNDNTALEWCGPVGVVAYATGGWTIPNNSEVAYPTFDNQIAFTSGFHTTPNNSITIPTGYGGYYEIHASGWWNSNANAGRIRRIAVWKNNNTMLVSQDATSIANQQSGLSCSGIFEFGQGDVITMKCMQNSGGDLIFNEGRLSVVRVR